MNNRMDEKTLRKKARSLETMLSRERAYSRSVTVVAEAAVKALEEVKNGEVQEAARSLREVVSGLKTGVSAAAAGVEVPGAAGDAGEGRDGEAAEKGA